MFTWRIRKLGGVEGMNKVVREDSRVSPGSRGADLTHPMPYL